MMRKAPIKSKLKGTKTYCYLRVSTADQDVDKFKNAVLDYSNKKNLGQVKFFTEKVSGTTSWRKRKVADILDILGNGDRLIVPELSRLGRSTAEVLEILNTLSDCLLRSITLRRDKEKTVA